ncbi:MAG TPA: phosphate ABC transporter ATP-binding protein [Bacteroidales bacterium]|nr:phosphate ABC transporter ATP-binding protein [Bacteroidales bacterium]
MQKSKISIQNLNLHFGRHHILKNVNIEIPENQLTIILGPSGCGKTTLLKTLNRLVELDEKVKIDGKIFIDNEDIFHNGTDVTRIRKKMGLLSQRPSPLPMSIFKNVAYGLSINGVRGKKKLTPLVEKYLRQANLWEEVNHRLKEPASRLSIGQQQRLCLARGLAVNPEILLADEPTSALDPISATVIEQQFGELKKDYTVVMVTHVLRQARRIADYVVFMYLGEVIEQGPVKEFFENPKMEKTREYLKGAFN